MAAQTKALEEARASVAKSIGAAEPGEIYFTGSGSESDNWAIKGAAFAKKGKHIITSSVAHPAVLKHVSFGKHGYEIAYIDVM